MNLFPRQVTFKESISVGRPSIHGRTVTEAAAWRDSQGIYTERQATLPPAPLSAGVCSQSAAPSITPRPPLASHCRMEAASVFNESFGLGLKKQKQNTGNSFLSFGSFLCTDEMKSGSVAHKTTTLILKAIIHRQKKKQSTIITNTGFHSGFVRRLTLGLLISLRLWIFFFFSYIAWADA